MAYSTNEDLFERMDEQLAIQLTDDDNTGSLDEAVLADKRATCFELVNAHLRGRYSLPLDPAPKILADVEADLLIDKLYSRRANIEKPESVKEDAKRAMDILRAIARGDITLEDQPNPYPAAFKTNKKPSDRKFPDSVLRRY